MSTNFYIESKGEQIHIGKRCAAGLYCHECSEDRICWDDNDAKPKSYCPQCGERNLEPTCSFTWAMEPHKLAFMLYRDADARIADECDTVYSASHFYDMLRDSCRLQFYTSIGTEFC